MFHQLPTTIGDAPPARRNLVGYGDSPGTTQFSLASIRIMRQTDLDMQSKYKETSKGGLAINVTEFCRPERALAGSAGHQLEPGYVPEVLCVPGGEGGAVLNRPGGDPQVRL